ncbi:hypothetical protein NPIL_485351, partial [Nephila pilipes]
RNESRPEALKAAEQLDKRSSHKVFGLTGLERLD